jgi:hypothetical protein
MIQILLEKKLLQINTNEIKNDIMKKNKTLSEIFPINPKVLLEL